MGIEEPESNMHPQAQRKFVEALKDNKHYPNTQFVLTTHSTVIIDRIGHESIALCRKKKGEKRDVVTTIKQTGADFLNRYGLDEERYYSFFDFKNSDFFFSNYIVVTESVNDCKVVQHLLEISGIDVESLGISFIPTDGERSMKYPYAIAKELDIPFICIVDRDVFQPYKSDKREQSLDSQGLPIYKKELKLDSTLLELINEKDQQLILSSLIKDKYKNALDLLENYHIIVMKYAFEVDLIVCASYCDCFYNVLNVSPENQNKYYLLTKMGNAIKKYMNIQKVIDIQGTKNLPLSYRQIIKVIKEMMR